MEKRRNQLPETVRKIVDMLLVDYNAPEKGVLTIAGAVDILQHVIKHLEYTAIRRPLKHYLQYQSLARSRYRSPRNRPQSYSEICSKGVPAMQRPEILPNENEQLRSEIATLQEKIKQICDENQLILEMLYHAERGEKCHIPKDIPEDEPGKRFRRIQRRTRIRTVTNEHGTYQCGDASFHLLSR